MGLLDEAGNLFNKGVASAQKGTRTLGIKSQINDLNKQREKHLTELGASLYEENRNNPEVRGPREGIFAAIESVDAQKANLEAELATIEQQAQEAKQAQQAPAGAPMGAFPCPTCGRPSLPEDVFCPGCGTNLAALKAAPAVKFCSGCGAPLNEGAAFCNNCGMSTAPAAPVADAAPVAAVAEAAAVADEGTPKES